MFARQRPLTVRGLTGACSAKASSGQYDSRRDGAEESRCEPEAPRPRRRSLTPRIRIEELARVDLREVADHAIGIPKPLGLAAPVDGDAMEAATLGRLYA